MARLDHGDIFLGVPPCEHIWPSFIVAPTPGIAKPDRRQDVERCRIRAVICDGRANENIVGLHFGVCHLDLEKTGPERTGILQLELRIVPRSCRVDGDQFVIWKSRDRIAINHLHETVRRRVVGVEINFLHIFAVIALRIG